MKYNEKRDALGRLQLKKSQKRSWKIEVDILITTLKEKYNLNLGRMELAIGKLVQDNLCNNAFTEQDKELNILNRWYGRLDCFIITSKTRNQYFSSN